MDRRTKGRLAEAKVLAYFIEQGYEAYTPFSDNSKYDLLVYKDGQLSRVSVKFTSRQLPSGSWEATMKNVSRRNHGTVVISYFDNSQYDLVAVYIGPESRVVVVPATQVGKTSLSVR